MRYQLFIVGNMLAPGLFGDSRRGALMEGFWQVLRFAFRASQLALVRHPRRLYSLSQKFSYPDYVDLRDQSASFSNIVAYRITLAGLAASRGGTGPRRRTEEQAQEGMGVKFVAMQQEDRARFARWLKRLTLPTKPATRLLMIRRLIDSGRVLSPEV